jgi:hypothetical protein
MPNRILWRRDFARVTILVILYGQNWAMNTILILPNTDILYRHEIGWLGPNFFIGLNRAILVIMYRRSWAINTILLLPNTRLASFHQAAHWRRLAV